MGTKPLDKQTKAELIALLQHVQILATAFDAQLVQRTADCKRLMAENEELRAKYAALESRRRFEGQCYRRGHRDTTISPRRAAMDAAKAEAMERGCTVTVR